MAGEKITEDEVEDYIAKYKLAMIDFSATWCPPCKFLDKVVEDIKSEYIEKGVGFAEIDVDENRTIAKKLNIINVPSIFFYKDGELCHFTDEHGNQNDRVVGALNKPQLTSLLDKLLKNEK